MSAFRSTGYSVFREGNPAVPDIEAEKRHGRAGHSSRAGSVRSGSVLAGGRRRRRGRRR